MASRVLLDRRPLLPAILAGATLAGGLITLALSVLFLRPAGGVELWQAALGMAGAAAIALAYQFPIYLRHNTKVCVMNVPLLLSAALLPPPLAEAAAGLGVLAGEVAVRQARGNHLTDIATNVGRWTAVALAGSAIAHLGGTLPGHALALAAAGLVLLAGDLLTLPLTLTPITGERPIHIIRTVAAEIWVSELALYAVAAVGGLAALYLPWTLVLLIIPTVALHLHQHPALSRRTLQTLEGVADGAEAHDPYMAGHGRRVAALTDALLQELGIHGEEARLITIAARLHDIGRIRGGEAELAASRGSDDETVVAREGADLLRAFPAFKRGLEMIRHVPEHWDGTGQPNGLAGTDIPFGARVIAVADAFDTLTSARPYRRALSADQAASRLLAGRGTRWDPVLVAAFLRSISPRLTGPVQQPALPAGGGEQPSEDAG